MTMVVSGEPKCRLRAAKWPGRCRWIGFCISPLGGNTGNLPSPGSKGIRGGGANRSGCPGEGLGETGLLVIKVLV